MIEAPRKMKPKNARRTHYLSIKLATAVKLCMENRFNGDQTYIAWDATDAICNILEALFVHGLRESYFVKNSREKYPIPNFWPFISKFTHSNIRAQICNLNQIKTDVGKARAWLRVTLNDCLLENYVNSITRELSIVKHFYHHYSYLMDTEEMEIMRSLVGSLSKLPFNAPINSSILNSWTITPLKLAGYLQDDKILALERSDGEPPDPDECEDVPEGVSALEFEGLGDAMLMSSSDSYSDSVSESQYSQSIMNHNAVPRDIVGVPVLGIGGKRSKSGATIFSDVESVLSTGSSSAAAANSTAIAENTVLLNADVKMTSDEQFMQILDACNISDDPQSNADASLPLPAKDNHNSTNDSPRNNIDSSASSAINIFDQTGEHQVPVVTADDSNLISSNSSTIIDNGCDKVVEGKGDEKLMSMEHENEEASADVSQESHDENEPHSDKQNSNEEDFEAATNPPGNSLSGRRGWSTGALVADDSQVPDDLPAGSPAVSTVSIEDGTFTTTLFRVFNETFSKIRSSVDYSDLSRRWSNSSTHENLIDSLEVSGSGFNDTSGTAGGTAGSVTSGTGTQGGRSESSPATATSSSNPQRRSAKLSSMESADSEYVVVEKVSVDLHPDEKRFRTACLTRLPEQAGLSEQEFKCNSCHRPVGLMFGPYRICEFDGRYYCGECHLNEENIVPARVLLNWDFKLRKVCRASKAFLDYMSDQPLIHLNEVNRSLVDVVERMAEIRLLRSQLCFAAMYLLTCRDVIADDFKKRVYPKEYFYDDIDLYSITDLKNIQNGTLLKQIKSLLAFAVKHVLGPCRLCVNKGYLCEICNSGQIIFPFQFDLTTRCSKCYTVYHKTCSEGRPCAKCVRREMYDKATFDSGVELCVPAVDF